MDDIPIYIWYAFSKVNVVFHTGMIKLVSKHRAQVIYTRNTKGGDEGGDQKDA